MKRIKKVLLFLLPLFCFMPLKVSAAELKMTSSKTEILSNEEFNININISGLTTLAGKISLVVQYDDEYLTIVNTKALQGTISTNPSSNGILIDVSDAQINNGGLIQLTLKPRNDEINTNIISVSATDCFNEFLTGKINVTGSTITIKTVEASDDNNLKTLFVSNCTLTPAFKPEITNYTCPDTNLENITITGFANNPASTITGNKTVKLNDGENQLKVIVTNQKGNSKTYTINIKKTNLNNNDNNDNNDKNIPNSNNDLKTLIIENFDIKFSPTTYEYKIDVPYETSSINISATSSNPTSNIVGIGQHNLKEGNNTIKINVVDSKNNVNTYTINVNRTTQEPSNPSTKITNITYNDKKIELTDKKIYLIGIDDNINNLNFNILTESKSAKTKVEGNNNLTSGINIIKITVSDNTLDDNIYTLVVNKKESTPIKDFSQVNEINENIIYETSKTTTIPNNVFKALKNSPFNLTYNYINSNNGVIYSLLFNNRVEYSENYNISFNNTNENPLTYNSNVPKNVNIKLFINPELISTSKLYLYSYNQEKNEYSLINDNLIIDDYYVSFNSTGASTYVFSEDVLNNSEAGHKIKKINKDLITKIIILFIGILIGVIGTLSVITIKNKKKTKKENNVVINKEIETL